MPGRRLDGSLPLNYGGLRDQIVIQSPNVTQNGFGENVISSWTDRVAGWANVRAMTGRELERVQQTWAEARFKVRMPYTNALTIQRDWRIAWGSRKLDILDCEDPDGMRREWIAYCKEIVS